MNAITSFLLSSAGKEALKVAREAALQSKLDPAPVTLLLRKRFPDLPPHMSNGVIETAIGREKLKQRGDWIQDGLFTWMGVAQATHPVLSQHHAHRFAAGGVVAEVGGGMGFDTYALSRRAHSVISMEVDATTASFARHNLSLQGVENVRVIVGDHSQLQGESFDALWADPARRDSAGRRLRDPERYSPPLSQLVSLAGTRPMGVKISSTMAMPHWSGAREWVGLHHELKEQILWRGVEVHDGTVTLPEADFSWIPSALPCEVIDRFLDSPFFLIEPHAAFIGSDQWRSFFAERGAARIDKGEAFGVLTELPPHHVAYERFLIRHVASLRLSEIQSLLHADGIGPGLEIKKRGVQENPDEWRKKLELKGKNHGVLIITHSGAKKIALIGERVR